jgi:hypothetical protein
MLVNYLRILNKGEIPRIKKYIPANKNAIAGTINISLSSVAFPKKSPIIISKIPVSVFMVNIIYGLSALNKLNVRFSFAGSHEGSSVGIGSRWSTMWASGNFAFKRASLLVIS